MHKKKIATIIIITSLMATLTGCYTAMPIAENAETTKRKA